MNRKTLDLYFDLGMISENLYNFYDDYIVFMDLLDDDFKLARYLLGMTPQDIRPSYLEYKLNRDLERVYKEFGAKIDNLLSKPSKEVQSLIIAFGTNKNNKAKR